MTIREQYEELIAAIETASVSARAYFDSNDFSNEQKDDGSVVTKIDQSIESAIRAFIQEHFPTDAIIGEEEADVPGTSGFVWHVDPIDGTDNFLRKIPFCAVSIARLGDSEEGSFAIVHNPITRHTFSAFESEGAKENEHPAVCYPEPLGGRYVVSIGQGRESWMRAARNQLIVALDKEFGKAAMYGCSALELAYVSAGRIDGTLTFGLSSYDYAAGLYLVRAAGGQISQYENKSWQPVTGSLKNLCTGHGKTLLVSHPHIHERLSSFIGDPRTWAPNS